jgi:uncharacterized protein YbjT (DUF2867 family)
MNVVIFGASGMVGQGVVAECLEAPGVESILLVGRSESGLDHPKLREICQPDLMELEAVADKLTGLDACYFCLGSSSAGVSEEEYRRINLDITLSVGKLLSRINPQMTFVYISGAGAGRDKRAMWARVKGEVEEELQALPFEGAYMFRIGFVKPGRGIKSRSKFTRFVYALLSPLHPLLKLIFGDALTTTEQVGKAMIQVSENGYSLPLMGNRNINEAANARIAA